MNRASMPRGVNRPSAPPPDAALWVARAVLVLSVVGGWVWSLTYIIRRYG